MEDGRDTKPPEPLASGGFSFGFADRTLEQPSGGDAGPSPPAAGAFVLTQRIGGGGQGDVWEAWQPSLRRTVAVKIHRGGSTERFEREALLTGSLEHPSIVPVLDFGALPGSGAAAMAMKRLRGTPWDELIARDHGAGQLPAHEGLVRHFAVLDAVCHAVAFAHARGVVHLDLKPSQVVVGEFGETYLCDWGMAARVLPDGCLDFAAPPAGAFGTPGYMAPEQALGDLEAVGVATDCYLLAATAYHVLSGRPPHPRAEGASAVDAARRNDVLPLGDGVPAALARTVLAGLSADPRARFRSAEEFRVALAAALRAVGQEAEARALCDDARRRLAAAADYGELGAIEQQLDRAAALAPEFAEATALRDGAFARHTSLAVERNDLALARVLGARIADASLREAAGAAIAQAEEAAAEKARQHARTRRAATGALAALAVVLVVATASLLAAFRRTEAALETSRRELARAGLQAAMSYLDKLRPADARAALRNVPQEWRGWEWGYLASRAAPENRLLRPRGEKFTAMALSADGSLLGALREGDGALLLIPVADPARVKELRGGDWSILGPGGAGEVLAANAGGEVVAFGAEGERRRLAAASAPLAFAGSAAGAPIYSVDRDGNVRRGDSAEPIIALGEPATALIVGRDAFAVGTASGGVIHGRHDGPAVVSTRRHTAAVLGFSWHPTDPVVASWAGSIAVARQSDSQAIIHRAGRAEPEHVTIETDTPMTAAAWSPDGGELSTTFGNAWLHVLSTSPWKLERSSHHGLGVAHAAHYLPDGSGVVLVARALVQVREMQWLGQTLALRGDSRRIRQHAMSGARLCTIGEDGGIAEWRLDAAPDATTFELTPDRITSLDAADSDRIVAAHRWGNAVGWNTAAAPVREAGSTWSASDYVQVRLTRDGDLMAGITAAGTLELARTGETQPFAVHAAPTPFRAVAMHPTGMNAVAAPQSGGVVSLAADPGAKPVIHPEGGPWSALEFSADGELLFAARADGAIDILDVRTFASRGSMAGHKGPVRRLTSDASGRWLVSAGEDETARLWDVPSQTAIGCYVGSHSGPVVSALLTPDGQRVITASEDGLMRVFDRETTTELAAFQAHQFGVLDMVLLRDGRRLATAGLDSRLRFWNPLPWDEGDGVLDADPGGHRIAP